MIPREKMALAMNAVMDQIDAIHRDHDDQVHGGAKCNDQRFSTAAFICHRFGITTDDWGVLEFFLKTLRDYEANCPDCVARRAKRRKGGRR